MTDDDLRVTDNPERHRFEAHLDGRVVAISTYRLVDDRIVFRHTETDDALEGRGIGSVLARSALAWAAQQGLAVVPQCAFVRGFLERHPEEVHVPVRPV